MRETVLPDVDANNRTGPHNENPSQEQVSFLYPYLVP